MPSQADPGVITRRIHAASEQLAFASSLVPAFLRRNELISSRHCSIWQQRKLQGKATSTKHPREAIYHPRRALTCSADELDYQEDEDLFDELTEDEIALSNEFDEGLPMLNKIVLTGRLGADPELRVIGDDLKVCKFSLAVSNEWEGDVQDERDKTSWFDVEAWGSLGSYVSKVAKKGMRVGLSGSLSVNSWQGKDGERREQPIVTAATFEVLQSSKEMSSGQDGFASARRSQYRGTTQSRQSGTPSLEDLPF